jgi:hypothetical protein
MTAATFATIDAIREANAELGHHWFDEGSMRFFGTRFESEVIGGRYFITSEQPPHGRRGFSIRYAADTGAISTISDVAEFTTLDGALMGLDAYLARPEVGGASVTVTLTPPQARELIEAATGTADVYDDAELYRRARSLTTAADRIRNALAKGSN